MTLKQPEVKIGGQNANFEGHYLLRNSQSSKRGGHEWPPKAASNPKLGVIFAKCAPMTPCPLLVQPLADARHHVQDTRLWWSVRSQDLAVEVPRSNLVSYARSFLPSTAQLWNPIPAQIPPIRSKASFSGEVIAFWLLLCQLLLNDFLSLLLMPIYAICH